MIVGGLLPTHGTVFVTFQGEKHDNLPQTVHDSRWSGQLIGWLASLTLEDEVRRDLSLPRVVCEYENVFWNRYRDYLHTWMWTLSLSYTLVHRLFL